MRTRTTGGVPVQLEQLVGRFDCWRRTREGRSRIPGGLWAAAVKVAGRYYRTVRARDSSRHFANSARDPFADVVDPPRSVDFRCLPPADASLYPPYRPAGPRNYGHAPAIRQSGGGLC
ncbi:MAG TPA: hypothetical protein PLL20_21475 [Phycisphaerae bacterium]|nr:hypothetical protein [Phycisphaerae bacterium]HRR85569.1 hypothetical protein [Phycisphaerae bacterium]